jgi:hypothetical protein
MSFYSIQQSEVQLERANLNLEKANQAVHTAQEALNKAIEKYGPDSQEAKDAADKLSIAQDAASVSADRQQMSQSNVNNAMLMTAVSILPATMAGFDGLSRVWGQLKDMDIASHFKGIASAITGIGGQGFGPMGSLLLGMGAIGAIMGAFTTSSGEMKAVLSLLAGAMIAAATAQWIFNAAEAFGLELSTLGMATAVIAVAAASAAAVYLLSSAYGASASGQTDTGTSGAASGVGDGGDSAAPATDITSQTMSRGNYKTTEIAYYAESSQGKDFYLWEESGSMYGKFVTADDLLRARQTQGKGTTSNLMNNVDLSALYPYVLQGYDVEYSGGQRVMMGTHLQSGGMMLMNAPAFMHKDEVALPLSDPRTVQALSAALKQAGGGTTIINNYIASSDPALAADQLMNRLRTQGAIRS